MKKLIACILFVLMSSVLFADERAELTREFEKIEKALEQAEADFWKKKYTLIELKQKTKDEMGELESEYNDLMKKRGTLKEEILSLAVDNKSLGERRDNYKIRISEIYSTYLKSLDELRTFSKRNVPFTGQEDIMKLGEIGNAVERKEGIIKVGESILNFIKSMIADSQTSSLKHTDIVTKDKSVEKGKKLRIGYIFNGYVTDSGNNGGLLLRTGKITQNAFEWHEDLSSSRMDLIANITDSINSKKEFAFLPLDVMQSKAVGKAYSTKDSFFKGLIEWFKSGGIVMYAIVFVLGYALFIIIDRAIVYRKNTAGTDSLSKSLEELIEKKDYDKAVKICEKKKNPLARLIREVFQDRKIPLEDAELKIQEVILHETSFLEKHLPTLKSLGALAPLLGLLGTVTGMISLFDVITVFGTGDPKLLAGGIAEALVTTEFGLIVAIPAMLFHRILLNNSERIITDLERFSFVIINSGWEKKK
jgi:biopolymer transport protein ExbB